MHSVSDRGRPNAIARGRRVAALAAAALLVCIGTASAQEAGEGDRVAALKQSLQAGMAALRQYEWVETTTISLKGEQKSAKENRCYYGADGAVQKIPIDTGQAEAKKSPRGLRGRIAKKKKGEMTEYMAAAVDLVKQYVPLDPARIQAVKDAGKLSVNPLASDRVQLQFRDYLKEGDVLSVSLDPTTNHVLGLQVASYLEKPDDVIKLDVTMNTLQDGALYASEIVLDVESKKMRVDIKNTGHRRHEAGP